MEHNTELTRSVAEVEIENRDDLGKTQKLLIKAEHDKFAWPLHMPSDDEVIDFFPNDIIVTVPTTTRINICKICSLD
jgi:hypothetical protein